MRMQCEKVASQSDSRHNQWSRQQYILLKDMKRASVSGIPNCLCLTLIFILILTNLLLTACGGASSSSNPSQPTQPTTPSTSSEPTTTEQPSPIVTPTTGSVASNPAATPTTGSVASNPAATPTTGSVGLLPTATQDPDADKLTTGGSPLIDGCMRMQAGCSFILLLADKNFKPITRPELINWTATAESGVTVVPSSGQLTSNNGDSADIHVTFPSPCRPSFVTITTNFPSLTITRALLCDPNLTLNLTNAYSTSDALQVSTHMTLSTSTPGCSLDSTKQFLNCVVTLTRTSDFQGAVRWEIPTDTTKVTVTPASGMIASHQSIPITISGISCNATTSDQIIPYWYEITNSAEGGPTMEWDKTSCSTS